jgi:integrase
METLETEEQQGETSRVFRRVAECLYRHESSGIYYALVKRSGKQFRRSLKTNDRVLAGRRLSKLREDVGRLSLTEGASKITFGDLAKRWLATSRVTLKPSSARRRETSVNQLEPFFGATPVRNVSARDCDDWVAKRGGKIAASTFNNELETLRAILELAKRDGLILENPAAKISRRKMGKAKIVIPTHEQFRSLVETIREADCRAQEGANLVELLAYSGMRLAEATALIWGEVDFKRESFTVTGGERGTKNHDARTVPLFPAMRQLLERLREDGEAEPDAKIIQIGDAKKAIGNACRKAKLPHFSHHTMRHYFVSNAIEAGVDFKVIAGWVGHKDGGILVAQTYGHLRDSHSFEMAKRMTFNAEPQPAPATKLQ